MQPVVAIVVDGGLPEYLVIDDWPVGLPKPAAVCVDLDQDPLAARCRITVDYGNSPEEALGHEIEVVESGIGQGPASGMDPRAALEQIRREMRRVGAQRQLESLEREMGERIEDGVTRAYFTSRLSEIRRDLYEDT